MDDSPVSSEQRARLLELEARQQQLKRLCEEALKQDEEHQHIFQQLEEHNMTSSTAGSFRGVGSGTAAPSARPTTAAAIIDDPMDDLMTGEVRSFRDPNSITRASSTGSAGGAPEQTGGYAPYAHRSSADRPAMTRLDSAYRPPTYPTAPESGELNAGPLPPPPPPRATLYTSTRQPRALGGASARALPTTGLFSPRDPPAAASSIPPSWRRESGDGETAASAAAPAAAARPALSSPHVSTTAPGSYGSYARSSTVLLSSPSATTLQPPPPPPPPPPAPAAERSRSLSHSVPLNDRFQRSGDYHVHATPPPPPPPPPAARVVTSPTQARVSPHSMTYGRSRVGLTSPSAAAHLPPPTPPPAAYASLVSPDEVSDKLPPPPPPPRTRDRFATPDTRRNAMERYRGRSLFVSPHARSPLSSPPRASPPPPPPAAATAAAAARVLTSPSTSGGVPPPPPPPPPPTGLSDVTRDGDSFLSTTSTDNDMARWRRQLKRADAALRSSPLAAATRTTAGGSWAEMRGRAATTQRGLQRHFDAAAAAATYSSLDGGRRSRVAPPPPPPPLPSSPLRGGGLSSPPPPPPPPPLFEEEDGGDGAHFSRWETASLSPRRKRAEEANLRRYFASDTKPVPRSVDDYLHAGTATSPRRWRATAQRGGPRRDERYHDAPAEEGDADLRHLRYPPPSTSADWSTVSHTRGVTTDRTATALRYDTSTVDESFETPAFRSAPASSLPPPPPPPPPEVPPWSPREGEAAQQADDTGARTLSAPKTRKKPSHPYGEVRPAQPPMAMPPYVAAGSTTSSGPAFAALYARQHRSTSAGLNSSQHSMWEADAAAAAAVAVERAAPAPKPVPAAAAPAVQPAAAAASEFFDIGPEKEALLTLLQESTRPAAPAAAQRSPPAQAAPAAAAAAAAAPPSVRGAASFASAPVPQPSAASPTARPLWSGAADATAAAAPTHPGLSQVPSLTSPTTPRRLSATGQGVGVLPGVAAEAPPSSHSTASAVAAAAALGGGAGSPQLQRQCDEATAKAEALARHLVKAITDRKLLQSNVEELEQLVEECNAEVGRLQHIVEEQHQDASTSHGVQAALRAKEREVAVYEDEIRRLNTVLEDHLARTSTTQHRIQEGVSHSLVTQAAEVEAAMAEVGMAHLAQQEAEERAGQLANELETAVEQIQFLDERLAEMERAAAAAQFGKANAHLRTGGGGGGGFLSVDSAAASASTSSALPLSLPSAEETRAWPVEARRAMAQIVAQAQGLLQQNAEGERHAAMRLQHVEHTCHELQQNLRRRDEEVARAQLACQQLAREKSALQACGEQWYQQLQEVKEDAQLVSEMMRTARGDAEEVYIASRVAEGRVAEQTAAAAAASPFRPAPAPSPVEVGTLQKTAHFAQQVMTDFHAVARFLASLRSMEIGDRNGYQILQSIATGRSPAEGLFITADDAATPIRLREQLSPDVTTEARQRVREKKARVLQAVERALRIDVTEAVAPLALQSSRSGSGTPWSDRGHGTLPQQQPQRPASASPPAVIPLGLPPRAGVERVATAAAAVVEGVTAPLTPVADMEMEDEAEAFIDDVADAFEPEVEEVASALQPARLGSYSYRGGSNGMVHSDVRRGPAEGGSGGLAQSHNSSQATPLNSQSASVTTRSTTATTAPPPVPLFAPPPAVVVIPPIPVSTLQHTPPHPQPYQQQPPSLARSPRTPIPLAASGVPVCSPLFMGPGNGAEEPASPATACATPTSAATAHVAAAVPQTAPPPSVSRPLRLSASPSQPQPDGREGETEAEEATGAIVVPPATHVTIDDVPNADLTVVSTPLQEKKATVRREASTITVVSSPSLSLQAPEWLKSPKLQQQQQQDQEQEQEQPTELSTDADELPAPSFSIAAAATASSPPSPPPPAADDVSPLAPVSATLSHTDDDGVKAVTPHDSTPTRHQSLRPSTQLRSPSEDDTTPRTRLRSPTPDRVQRPALDIVTSPLDPPPRTSVNSVNEPPPRAVREDSMPSQTGSHPKARSTTARPPSTPPGGSLRPDRWAAEQGDEKGEKKAAVPSRVGVRRAASEQSNDDDDEATLFFREPARGVVHEVMPPKEKTRDMDEVAASAAECVEVDLLQDDFVMPSRKAGATPPGPVSQTAVQQRKGEPKKSVTVVEAHPLPELLPPPRSPTVPHERSTAETARVPSESSAAQPLPPLTRTTRDVADTSGATAKEPRSRSSRSRRVVDADEDDEPSLQFAAPPLPPPRTTALPRPLSAESTETDSGAAAAASALSSTSLSPTDGNASHSFPPSSSEAHGGAVMHRPLHQPRRPQPADTAPSLSVTRSGADGGGAGVGGGVAPPRLQRSATPSPSSAAPPVGPPVPLSSRAESSRPRRASSDSREGGAAGAPMPEATPTLAEPQRAALTRRSAPTVQARAPASAPTTAATPPEVSVSVPHRTLPVSQPVVRAAESSNGSEALVEEVPDVLEAAEEDEVVSELEVRSGTATPNRGASRVPAAMLEPVADHDDEDVGEAEAPAVLLRSGSGASALSQPPQTPSRLLSSGAVTATPGSPPESDTGHLEPQPQPTTDAAVTAPSVLSSSGLGLPHVMRYDTVEPTAMSVSQPADPLPAAPGQSREQGREGRSSSSGATTPRRAGRSNGGGGVGSGSEPAPLPTVNVDAPESNTLGLRRASPPPPAVPAFPAPLTQQSSTPVVTEAVSSFPTSPRSRSGPSGAYSPSNSSLSTSPRPDAANATRRRDDVTRILERIRAKREQEQERKSGAATPTTATAASPSSSSPAESEDPSFTVE